jgi:hypothetical protein
MDEKNNHASKDPSGARGGSSGYVEPFNAWTEDPTAAEVEVVRADVVRLVVPGKWRAREREQ